MPIKKLKSPVSRCSGASQERYVPEGCARSSHVLPQRPHDAVRTSAVAKDVDGSWDPSVYASSICNIPLRTEDEADDAANG